MNDVVGELGLLTLGTRLKRVGDRLQAQAQDYMEAVGIEITAAQFPLLAAVHQLGPLTIGELAEALGVTQPGVTRSVRQLARLGYLATRPGREDQRCTEVHLTAKSEALVAKSRVEVWPRIEKAVADLCGDFGESLLSNLAMIETGLEEEDLRRRIARHDRDHSQS